MGPYIHSTYKKLHIINLEKSVTHFNSAIKFIEKITSNNSKILFVGTKRAARNIIEKHAQSIKMPYVNNRWLGGMLTNFDTVKKSIQKLDSLNKFIDSTSAEALTKKESLGIKKQIAKLNKNLFGIKDMEKLPDAVFIIDTRYEKIAIQEANKLNIPVIAIVDSNNSYEGVEYMIPGNDDSMSSIELFVSSICDVISKTKVKFSKPAESANAKSEIKSTKNDASKTKSIKKKQVIKVDSKTDTKKSHSKKPTTTTKEKKEEK